MATRLSDSLIYRHLWTDPELDRLLTDTGRTQCWLTILGCLAQAQAELGIIATASADAIATVQVGELDLDYIAEQTRLSGHSTLGLIRGLEQVLPPHVHQDIYYGVTVQDISDTWFALLMRDTGDLVAGRLEETSRLLGDLARQHRDSLMPGRTHGQPGAPITFGIKAAGWAQELARHLERLAEGRNRWAVGQLAGAVGVLGFFHPDGLALRQRFCELLGLDDPGIGWLTSRDRIAEFGHTLAMVSATLGRIGGEIYELQRPEIDELAESRASGGVSSITMPHKRNPESSEHLVTLSRLVRSQSQVLLEGMDAQHERDGRGWKAEWIALPEVCELTSVATSIAVSMIAGLEVHTETMAQNLRSGGVLLHSEQVLAGLSRLVGKHRAQALLQEVLAGADPQFDLVSALAERGIDADHTRQWLTNPVAGVAGEQVDRFLANQSDRSQRVNP